MSADSVLLTLATPNIVEATIEPLDRTLTVTYRSVGAVAIEKLLTEINVEVIAVGVTFVVVKLLVMLSVIPLVKFVP